MNAPAVVALDRKTETKPDKPETHQAASQADETVRRYLHQ